MARARGYSLLELMLTLFIVMLAMGMGFAVARGGRSHMTVHQVAQQLLADLRWARQQAMTRAVPAGLLLPQAAAGQGYDVVSADVDEPGAIRVVRAEDWAAEGRYAVLAVGTWSGLPFQPADPPFNGRQDPGAQRLLAQCAGTWPGRYVMFDPNGTAVTSGVPNANGEHYLVVTAGLQESGGSMNAIWAPATTVCISTNGSASAVDGVPSFPALQAGLAPVPTLGQLPPSLPVGPRLYPKPYAPPAIVSLDVLPTANANTLPPGAVAGRTYTLAPNGRMSLTVTAQDPNGDALYCNWYSAAVPGVPANTAPMPPSNSTYDAPASGGTPGIGGTFSVTGIRPMARSTSTAGQWTDTVEWSPPSGAIPGEWFELGVVIDDLRGGKDARWIVVGLNGGQGIVYQGDTPSPGDTIFLMDEDGTDPQTVCVGHPPETYGRPVVSPDGTKVAMLGSQGDVVSVNIDGSGLRVLVRGTYPNFVRWSANGAAVFFDQTGPVVGTVRADGSGQQILTVTALPPPYSMLDSPACSPDGNHLAFTAWNHAWGDGNLRNIFVTSTDGSGPALQVTRFPPTGGDFNPAVLRWSPGGSRILYLSGGSRHLNSPDAYSRADLCVVNADGTGGETDLTPATPHFYDSAVWTSDGSRIVTEVTPFGAFGGGGGVGDIYIMRADGSNETALTTDHTSHNPDWRR